MTRQLIGAVLSAWVAITVATPVSAATKTILAKHENNQNFWDPAETTAAVGDVIEWKIASGTHGVRITNWNDIKGNVDVVMVTGQQPFNATTGRNDNSSGTADQVLLQLKLKTIPSAPIQFNCIVHGAGMSGKVTVAATAPAVKTILAKHEATNFWDPADTTVAVGDIIEWKISSGTHGVRITNWNDIKGNVEVVMVTGQQPFNATTGRNDNSSSTVDQVLLQLKVKSVPSAHVKFNCIVHGVAMSGKVTVAAAAPRTTTTTAAKKTIQAKHENNTNAWDPADTTVAVGDIIEWKISSGTHGVRITNWNDIKGNVEVVMVTGQQPFNATTGRNDNSSSTVDQVLLQLKVKSVPSADVKFNCIVHGVAMSGKVTVSSSTNDK